MGNERIARIRFFVKSIFCSFACHVSCQWPVIWVKFICLMRAKIVYIIPYLTKLAQSSMFLKLESLAIRRLRTYEHIPWQVHNSQVHKSQVTRKEQKHTDKKISRIAHRQSLAFLFITTNILEIHKTKSNPLFLLSRYHYSIPSLNSILDASVKLQRMISKEVENSGITTTNYNVILTRRFSSIVNNIWSN